MLKPCLNYSANTFVNEMALIVVNPLNALLGLGQFDRVHFWLDFSEKAIVQAFIGSVSCYFCTGRCCDQNRL